MSEKQKIKHALIFPIAFLLTMWLTYWVFWFAENPMSVIGISPLEFKGIAGIFLSPFAHGSFSHLMSNSVSFLVLSVALFYFYRLVAYRVFFINWIVSGILLWLGGRGSVHIGASGIVYGLAFFLFFSGVFRKDKRLGAVSMIVVFLYGSMVWGMMPQGGNISWEGHLFGALAGISLAWYYRRFPIDFVPVNDGSSVSVTWGRYNQFEYHYIDNDDAEELNEIKE